MHGRALFLILTGRGAGSGKAPREHQLPGRSVWSSNTRDQACTRLRNDGKGILGLHGTREQRKARDPLNISGQQFKALEFKEIWYLPVPDVTLGLFQPNSL